MNYCNCDSSSVESHGGKSGSRSCEASSHIHGVGASHGDGHVVDLQVHVRFDDTLVHASEVLVLGARFVVLEDGTDAALGGVAGISAVSIELALSLLAADFKVLGLNGIKEVLIELSDSSSDVFLILWVLLVDHVVDIFRVRMVTIVSMDLPVSLRNVVLFGGMSSHRVVIVDGQIHGGVFSGGGGQESHCDSSSLHFLFSFKK